MRLLETLTADRKYRLLLNASLRKPDNLEISYNTRHTLSEKISSRKACNRPRELPSEAIQGGLDCSFRGFYRNPRHHRKAAGIDGLGACGQSCTCAPSTREPRSVYKSSPKDIQPGKIYKGPLFTFHLNLCMLGAL